MGAKVIDAGGRQLPLDEFLLSSLVADPSIVMIAKRGSGKSYVCRAILNHFKNIPCGLIIAPTDRMSCFYSLFFSSTYIFYKYKSEIIEKILYRQQLIIKKEKEKAAQGKKIDPRTFIIMDDCLASKGSWMRDDPIQELLFNGRHFKIMYILTVQYPLGITPELRGNFDYVFLLAEDFVSNMKRIHEHYAGMFPNFESFKKVFMELTKDYGCMVLSNRGAREKFSDKVFWYKAPKLSNEAVKIGCPQFVTYHNKNFNPMWEETKGKSKFNIEDQFNKKKSERGAFKISRVENQNERRSFKSD